MPSYESFEKSKRNLVKNTTPNAAPAPDPPELPDEGELSAVPDDAMSAVDNIDTYGDDVEGYKRTENLLREDLDIGNFETPEYEKYTPPEIRDPIRANRNLRGPGPDRKTGKFRPII